MKSGLKCLIKKDYSQTPSISRRNKTCKVDLIILKPILLSFMSGEMLFIVNGQI